MSIKYDKNQLLLHEIKSASLSAANPVTELLGLCNPSRSVSRPIQ